MRRLIHRPFHAATRAVLLHATVHYNVMPHMPSLWVAAPTAARRFHSSSKVILLEELEAELLSVVKQREEVEVAHRELVADIATQLAASEKARTAAATAHAAAEKELIPKFSTAFAEHCAVVVEVQLKNAALAKAREVALAKHRAVLADLDAKFTVVEEEVCQFKKASFEFLAEVDSKRAASAKRLDAVAGQLEDLSVKLSALVEQHQKAAETADRLASDSTPRSPLQLFGAALKWARSSTEQRSATLAELKAQIDAVLAEREMAEKAHSELNAELESRHAALDRQYRAAAAQLAELQAQRDAAYSDWDKAESAHLVLVSELQSKLAAADVPRDAAAAILVDITKAAIEHVLADSAHSALVTHLGSKLAASNCLRTEAAAAQQAVLAEIESKLAASTAEQEVEERVHRELMSHLEPTPCDPTACAAVCCASDFDWTSHRSVRGRQSGGGCSSCRPHIDYIAHTPFGSFQ